MLPRRGRDRLQAAGVPSYWRVDPDGPSLTVLELEHGTYREVGRAAGYERPRGEVEVSACAHPGRGPP